MCFPAFLCGVVVFGLLAGAEEQRSSGLLKPGFGVAFSPVGYVQPALDHRYLVLDIAMPQYTPFQFDESMAIVCDDVKFNDNSRSLCTDYQEMVNNFVETATENDKIIQVEIDRIIQILPSELTGQANDDSFGSKLGSRNKRAIPLLIPIAFGIASGIANIINTVDMRRKMGLLTKTMSVLAENDYLLSSEILELNGEIATVAQITSDEFDNVYVKLNRTNNNIVSLARKVKVNMDTVIAAFQTQRYVLTSALRAMTMYSNYVVRNMNAVSKHYNALQWYLHSYKEGVLELMQGKLPSSLVTPHDLSSILTRTAQSLYHTNPSYELVFKSVAHYYRKTDIMYASKDGHIFVTVPLLLKKVNQKPMELFRIEQCYVPYIVQNGTNSKATSHTKVVIEADFIAIGDHNFAEISHAQLDSCTNYNGLFLCGKHILQIHESSPTCSSAIFWDMPPSDVNDHCEFRYIHEIRPSPCILEADDLVLLTNMGSQWSFRCSHDNVPQRVIGSNFAVIHRDNFCSCALVGQNYFIPQRMKDCTNRPDKVTLLFPINAAVASVFHKDISNAALLHDLSKLYPIPPNLNIPPLNITMTEIDPDVLIDNDLTQSIDLKRIAKVMHSKQQVYLDRQQKNRLNQHIGNWFSGFETISLGITFLLALLGAFAAFVALYNCVKGHRIMALFGALATQPHNADAFRPDTNEADVHYGTILKERLFQVCLVLLLFGLYRLSRHLYNRWSVIKILIPNTVAVHKGAISHIHLEIGTPLAGICKLYICSIYTTILNLELVGTMTISGMTLVLSRCRTHGVLHFLWSQATFKIMNNNLTVALPELAYVAIWSFRKLNRILKEKHMVRVLLTYDGLTYVLTQYYILTSTDHTLPHDESPDMQAELTVEISRPMPSNDPAIPDVRHICDATQLTADMARAMYPSLSHLQTATTPTAP